MVDTVSVGKDVCRNTCLLIRYYKDSLVLYCSSSMVSAVLHTFPHIILRHSGYGLLDKVMVLTVYIM